MSEVTDSRAMRQGKQERAVRGDWIQTYTGRAFYPMSPRVEDIVIYDIAHALSHLCRFGGHCVSFYSVAEHSLLLSHVVPHEHALWALLHDASEAYLVDVPRPIKKQLPLYAEAESAVMVAICARFGLDCNEPDAVKDADLRILTDEAQQIMTKPPMTWQTTAEPLGVKVKFYDPLTARSEFLYRFAELRGSFK